MSINMGDSSGVEYADHEVQVLGGKTTIDTDIAPGDSADYLFRAEPVSDRGIDSDEIAELVYVFRNAQLAITGADANSQTEVGDIRAEGGLGINLGPEELPTRLAATGTRVQDDPATIVINEQDGGIIALDNYDEPGVLDIASQFAEVGFNELGDGTGGPGSGSTSSQRDINMSDNFGSGPYVDRTDDLSYFAEVEAVNLADGVRAEFELTYFLYWNVHEMPEGRASFARP